MRPHRSLRAALQQLLLLPPALLALGPPQLALVLGEGVTYHVSGAGDDSGDGSEGSPWRTISHAVASSDPEDTIQVGSGTYDSDAGEKFPINIDYGARTLAGPGDGSAVIDYSLPSPLFNFACIAIRAQASPNDPVSISGLTFDGHPAQTGAGQIKGFAIALEPPPGPVGPDLFIITDNVFERFEYAIYADVVAGQADILIEDNIITDGKYGVYLRAAAFTALTDCTVDCMLRGNSFTSLLSHAISIDNYITQQGSSIPSATISMKVVVEDNFISDLGQGAAGAGVTIHSVLEDVGTMNLDFDLVDNEIVDAERGVYMYSRTSSGEDASLNVDMLLEGNRFQDARADGIYRESYFYGQRPQVDLGWQMIDNVVAGSGGYGACIKPHLYGSGGAIVHSVALEGNELIDNSLYGLRLSVSLSGATASGPTPSFVGDWDVTHNEISENYFGVELHGDSNGTSDFVSYEVEVRGNTLAGNESNDLRLSFEYDSPAIEGEDFLVSLDAGTQTLYGYNTFRSNADGASPLMGGSPASSADLWVADTGSQGVGVDSAGNWWGTTDLSAVEDQIWHQADVRGALLVDFSNPLPDGLDFTASGSAEGAVTLEAGSLSGFVSHAGSQDIEVRLQGVLVENAVVSSDYRSLSFEAGVIAGGEEVCVINPGGQQGCATVVLDDGGGGDCDNNHIPTAIYDGATVQPEGSVTINVLTNDYDTDGVIDPSSVTLTQLPAHGTLEHLGEGVMVYTPPLDWVNNSETFNYTVADNCGDVSNTATVGVTVTGVKNHTPTAVFDSAIAESGESVVINVLDNDYDYDGDAVGGVTIVGGANKGSAVVNGDGTVTYTPNAATAVTTDTFNYSVTDEHGAVSNFATVGITILPLVGGKGLSPGWAGRSGASSKGSATGASSQQGAGAAGLLPPPASPGQGVAIIPPARGSLPPR